MSSLSSNHGFQTSLLKPEGFRPYYISLSLTTIAIGILSLALPIMTLQVYDRILPNPGNGTLAVLIIGVCVAILLETCLRLCRFYVINRSGATYEHLTSVNMMERVLNAELSKLGSLQIGEYLHRASSIGRLKDFYNGYTFTVLIELTFVPIFLGLIYYVGGEIVLVPIAVLSLFILVSLLKGVFLRSSLKQREETDDKRFNFLIETLEGIHTVKSFALENLFNRRYEDFERKSTQQNFNVTSHTASIFNNGAIYSHAMVTFVIAVGAYLVLNGQLTTGALVASLLLSGRVMQPVQKGLALWVRYQDFSLAKDHIEKLMNTPQVKKNTEVMSSASDQILQIKDLSFAYKDSGDLIHKDVNISLSMDKTVLVSGTHGSGKTTLLKIISGVYGSDRGTIIINGQDIASYKNDELAKHVGYLNNQPVIFRGTIRDNITCFGETDIAEAREIADLLDVNKEVAQLPAGFDTFLNGNGKDVIPPGLQQKISIVRSLARKPKIILFDNADSMLDRHGYGLLYNFLAKLKGKAAMILVTNDANIADLADCKYLMEDGVLKALSGEEQTSNIYAYRK